MKYILKFGLWVFLAMAMIACNNQEKQAVVKELPGAQEGIIYAKPENLKTNIPLSKILEIYRTGCICLGEYVKVLFYSSSDAKGCCQ